MLLPGPEPVGQDGLADPVVRARMSSWIDPRTNPTPPWQGLVRRLADDDGELSDLMAACKAGRIYDVEAWTASGRALQMDLRGQRRRKTALGVAIGAGHFDLVRLLAVQWLPE